MEIVLAALVTQLGALVVLLVQNRRQRSAVDSLTEKVQTNHGLEPREYLEMIAEVSVKLDMVAAGQHAVVGLIVEHTAQDERNFAALEQKIEALSAA